MPRTLFLTASHGFSSISGTCLCAAAWKTISGWCCREHGVDARRVGDVADDRDAAPNGGFAVVAARCGSRAGCSRSARTSRSDAGFSVAIWRHSSEPIEPPAPVTITRRPRDQLLERPAVEADRRARQQVLDRQVADLAELDLAVDDVAQVRQRLDRNLERLERADDRRGSAAGSARGIAISTSSGRCCSRIRGRSPRVPSTGTPWIRRPDLRRVVVDEADRLVADTRGWSSCRGRSSRRRRRRR